MIFEMQSIGVVQSPFSDKFGIPRQPELVPAAQTIIALNREFGAESVRGLAEFDYIWVQFVFHEALSQGWVQMVRPPRLGGKEKKRRICHTFATSSESYGFVAVAFGGGGRYGTPYQIDLRWQRFVKWYARVGHQTVFAICGSTTTRGIGFCARRTAKIERDLANRCFQAA